MVLLTVAIFFISPQAGFIWVVLWSGLSTVLLALRFIQAAVYRLLVGRLRPWIEDIDPEQENPSQVIQWFTGQQAIATISSLIKR